MLISEAQKMARENPELEYYLDVIDEVIYNEGARSPHPEARPALNKGNASNLETFSSHVNIDRRIMDGEKPQVPDQGSWKDCFAYLTRVCGYNQ